MNQKSQSALEKVILKAVGAGQQGVQRISTVATPKKELKKLKKRLRASRNWQVNHCLLYHSSGLPVDYIASWQGLIELKLKGRSLRFKLIALDRSKERIIFAVPTLQIENLKDLPGTGLTQADIQLLKLMADEVSTQQPKPRLIESKHPVKADIKQHLKPWRETTDEDRAFRLLSVKSWLLSVVAAALDAQLHAFKYFREVPIVIHNFTTNDKNPQADSVFFTALTAVNFSGAAHYRDAAPIEIFVREESDLNAWRGCVDRLVLIRTATGAQLAPLLDEFSERERIKYCGGVLPPPPPTIPIIRCRSFFQRRGVLDVELPKDLTLLTTFEQDTLRTMMSNTLSKADAQNVYDDWRMRMSRRDAYRTDPYICWRQVLAEQFLYANFHDPEKLGSALQLFGNVAEKQRAEEEKRERAINAAVELISDTSRYEREIANCPATCDEARRILDIDAEEVAFWFTPSKGNDKGKKLVAFSKSSLLRLLARIGGGESIIEVVLNRCELQGLLDQRKRSITIGGKTFNAITFLAT